MQVPTPLIDTQTVDPDEGSPTGILGPVAASILMQVLYISRLARFDLLKVIAMLAARITKWTRRCDKQLNRLMSYIDCTVDELMMEYIGGDLQDLHLELFRCRFRWRPRYSKEYHRYLLTLSGPNSFFPLNGSNKKTDSCFTLDARSRNCCGGSRDSNRRASCIGLVRLHVRGTNGPQSLNEILR